MEPFFFLLIPAGVAAITAVAVAAERRRARAKAWRRAVGKAELTVVEQEEGGLFAGGWLHARGGRLNVRLERPRQGQGEYRTLISVDGLGHGAAALSLRPEDFGTGLRRRLLGSDVEVGAPAFDGAVFLQGQSALALAVLDAKTRDRVADLLKGSVRGHQVRASMRDGVLEVWLQEQGRPLSAKRLTKALEGVLDIARRLEAPRDVAARIAESFGGETEAGVRREMVLALAREFAEHPKTIPTLRAALRDPSGEVRLRAAVALGEEGRETLLALVQNEGTEDACAAGAIAALSALGHRLPIAEIQAALEQALARGRTQTVQAYVEVLAAPDDAKAERLLLEILRHRDPWVAVIAARALGRVGTSAAVGPLREASASLWSGELGSVARLAIAEIQSRLTGAAPGQLSLAGGEAGALSLAGGETGALSLAESEPGAPGLGARDAPQAGAETDDWPPGQPPAAQTA